MSRLVLLGDQISALRDICHDEVATLAWDRLTRERHLVEGLSDVVSIGDEQSFRRLNEGLTGFVVAWLASFVQGSGEGYLTWRAVAVKDSVGDHSTVVN